MTEVQTQAVLVTKEEIAVNVVRMVRETNVSHLEALNTLVDEFGIDVDDIRHYISDALLVKLKAEAERLNLLKEKSKVRRLF